MSKLLSICLLFTLVTGKSQGGFSFMNLPASGQVAAVGGYAVSATKPDISMGYHNPALLDSVGVGDVHFLYNPFLGGIDRFNVAYQLGTKKAGNFAIGMTYTAYGEFEETDDIGTELGEFRANDYVIYVGKCHRLGLFTLGANLKFAGSSIYYNNASALTADFGGVFTHPTQEMTVGLVIKNFGFVLSDYSFDNSMTVPFNVEFGTSFKPQYMPFRFTLTVSDLLRTNDDLYIQNTYDPPNNANKLFRYVNLGGALLIGKNIEILLGYNHRRREELKQAEGAYGAGFSYGFLLKIKDYHFRFSQAKFHAAGGSTFLSISTNTNTIKNIF